MTRMSLSARLRALSKKKVARVAAGHRVFPSIGGQDAGMRDKGVSGTHVI
jgi:hypothetical protein